MGRYNFKKSPALLAAPTKIKRAPREGNSGGTYNWGKKKD